MEIKPVKTGGTFVNGKPKTMFRAFMTPEERDRWFIEKGYTDEGACFVSPDGVLWRKIESRAERIDA